MRRHWTGLDSALIAAPAAAADRLARRYTRFRAVYGAFHNFRDVSTSRSHWWPDTSGRKEIDPLMMSVKHHEKRIPPHLVSGIQGIFLPIMALSERQARMGHGDVRQTMRTRIRTWSEGEPLCLRNSLLPMSPVRTKLSMMGARGLEPQTFCV